MRQVEGTPNMLDPSSWKTSRQRQGDSVQGRAEKLLCMDLEEAMNLIGETQVDRHPSPGAREDGWPGGTLFGKVNYNEYSDQLEFVVNEIG